MAQTWADIVAAGKGRAEFRVKIEGVAPSFCTPGLTTGTDSADHVRYGGLLRESLGFSESCYLAGAEQDIQIQPIRIADDGGGLDRGQATALFSTIARALEQVTQELADTDTTATVRDNTLLSGATGYVGTETIAFGSPVAMSITVVDITTRGVWSSTAQTHYAATGTRPSTSVIYDHPPGFVGRRIWLYAHGPGETGLSDAGTVVWRGMIGKEPSESGGIWTVQIESRLKLLDGPLAGGFGSGFKLRGIYYPAEAPLFLSIARHATLTYDPGATISETKVLLHGFFATQSAFCLALTAALNANTDVVSWGNSFEARTVDDGGWDLFVRIATGTPRYVEVVGGSTVDGKFNGLVIDEATAYTRGGSSGTDTDIGPSVAVVVSDTVWRCQRDPVGSAEISEAGITGADLRQVPRSNHGGRARAGTVSDADIASYPMGRIYLDRLGALSTSDSLVIKPPQTTERAQVVSISVVSSAGGYVHAYEGYDIDRPPHALAVGGYQPEITGAARYASGDGDLEDLRADIVLRAPDLANLALGPWLTSDDCASWATPVDEAAAGRAWLLHREYIYTRSIRAIDALKEEWKLYSLIPYLDADAKIAVRPFTLETREPDWEIGPESVVIDDGFGKVAGDDDGLVTVVRIKTGYDPTEDKHFGDSFNAINIPAIARVKREVAIEVLPKSRAVGPEMDEVDATAIGVLITEIFGSRRTQTVEVDVTIALFDALIGDAVSLTVPQLPGDGTRGIWASGQGLTARTGYIVSRSWNLATGVGRMRVLLHELSIAGYTPTGRVASATGATTAWVLTLEAARYSGTNDSLFFSVGDSMRLVEWDAASPTVVRGVIDAVNTGTYEITVTLDGSWAGPASGSAIWNLMWDLATDADTTAAQLLSAYAADSTGRIQLASGSSPATRFAP